MDRKGSPDVPLNDTLRRGLEAKFRPCHCGGVMERVWVQDPTAPTEMCYRMRCGRCDRIEPVNKEGT